MKCSSHFLPFVVFILGFCLAQQRHNPHAAQKVDNDGRSLPADFLTNDSVVMITGASGFLGSELALALYRTYSPKRIILVDRMVDHPQTQEELALFEFQRQRSFHVLQTLKSTARFYRVDFSPMIPEYFDLGEVPVLDHIFREHPDITHVVHLADPYPHSAVQVVPREKEVPKAGMVEALMEQLAKHRRETGRLPHFCYASSFEVYPFAFNATVPQPLTETLPLSTPSSLRGASKMMDEMLAKLYYDTKGIYSVGLRFFSVYGPWGVPGSPLFEMAERAVTGDLATMDKDDNTMRGFRESVHDFVYIDDAVDAVMAAMQFRPQVSTSSPATVAENGESWHEPHPVIFNVATGHGHSLEDVAKIMQEFFPTDGDKQSHMHAGHGTKPTVSVGSTKRAESVLGYRPQVSMRDGIIKTLAWHYDRAFPYGGRQNKKEHSNEKSDYIASQGIESCLPYDKECLRAAPVFPCASECSHEAQCTKSYFDEVIAWTQSLTSECETVLYTVDLDESLSIVPSAHLKLKTTSKSFLKGNCNLAFVLEQSRLVQSLRNSYRMSSFIGSGQNKLLRNGAWILVPLNVPSNTSEDLDSDVVKLLPKLSPGLFFGSNTKRAIYVDSNILLDSIPNLLREAATQPYNEEMEGATAMLIGRGTPKDYFSDEDEDNMGTNQRALDSSSTLVQNSAYRMVRIAVADKLFGDGFMELLDSRWMVHTLQSDDARLFRCDVLGEVVQWEVDSDRSALEFVLGLHDMWSRVIVKASGVSPWWIGDNVVTVPEQHIIRRRLMEESGIDKENQQVTSDRTPTSDEDDNLETEARAINGKIVESSDDDEILEETSDEQNPDDSERGGFVLDAGAQQEVAADEEKRGESSDEHDDDELQAGEREGGEDLERDFSAYDTWMGILSSSSVKYFVRIVKSSEVGVVSIDGH